MKTNKLKLGFLLAILFYSNSALAHCPLCTIGGAGLSLGAVWLGAKVSVVGIFMGAFAFAIGLWFGKIIKLKTKFKELILATISWLLTIVPLRAIFQEYSSVYIYLWGDYGSLLNRTYLIDNFLLGAFIGAVLTFLAPYLSKLISQKRGKTLPYQGLTLTFILLAITALIFQFLL